MTEPPVVSSGPPEPGRWVAHGERPVYESDWVGLSMVDVERPDGSRLDHHVVRVPRGAAGVIVVVDDRILLMWRHRFVTDTWGWEIPAGRIDPGETPEEAAARETLEETGWRPGPLRSLFDYHPANGLSDHHFHIFEAQEATHVGEPTDPNEAARLEWLPVDEVRSRLARSELGDGLTLTALAWWLAVGGDAPEGVTRALGEGPGTADK